MLNIIAMGLITCGLHVLAFGHADAQTFPARPIRMIVPYPPGGAPDIAARLLSQPILESTGQQLIVDNRPGAGALIGADAVARAAPDGYTVLMVDSTLYSINPNLLEKFPYEILRDFTPIIHAVDTAILLAVNPGLGIETLRDYLSLAKSKPGLPFGSSGPGTGHHLAMELLAQLGQVQLTHIPYKGAGQSIPAVIAGDVSAAFAGPTAINPQVRAGKLKVLGMTAGKRSALIPDVPTLAEAGLPGYEMRLNMGILGPGNMPTEIIAKLNTEFGRALNLPDVKQRLGQVGQEVNTGTPQAFADVIRTDRAFYAKLVESAGLKKLTP